MKIALAQMDVKPNQPQMNLMKMREMMVRAFEKEDPVDTIVFPEMCISGYLVGDKWTDDQFCSDMMTYNKAIIELSAHYYDKIIIWGNVFVDLSKVGHDGRPRRYNAAYIAENGIVSWRFKTLLPNYRMFDDKRYFYSSMDKDSIEPYITQKGERLGITLCEDLWCENETLNPSKVLIYKGAQVLINLSASPFSVDKWRARDSRVIKLSEQVAEATGQFQTRMRFVPYLYCNCVGVQNNGKSIVTFDGDSRIYDSFGTKQSYGLEPYEEGILVAYVNTREAHLEGGYIMTGKSESLIHTMNSIEQKFHAIKRAYVSMWYDTGCKMVIGLSGGIDSAVSATIAVLALGKDNVLLYNLPSKYNSDSTKNIAMTIARHLETSLMSISIEKLMEAAGHTFNNSDIEGIHEENLQARFRGLMLQTLASANGGVVVSNANKIEVAAGYSTYGGDDIGAFMPLGDLLKTEVFEMARFLNLRFSKDGNDIIPEAIIANSSFNVTVPPSAELAVNQKDPFLWGLDDAIIDGIMTYKKKSFDSLLLLYDSRNFAELEKIWGIKKEWLIWYKFLSDDKTITVRQTLRRQFIGHLEWLMRVMEQASFKRIQAPPIVVLSKSAFGYDYRESILRFHESETFAWLKKQENNEEVYDY